MTQGMKPVVNVGKNGLTDGLVEQVRKELDDKGTIKVKLLRSAADDRHERQELAQLLADKTDAEVVETVGRTVILDRG